jgi:hypothetical protein
MIHCANQLIGETFPVSTEGFFGQLSHTYGFRERLSNSNLERSSEFDGLVTVVSRICKYPDKFM